MYLMLQDVVLSLAVLDLLLTTSKWWWLWTHNIHQQTWHGVAADL